jgi:hypothetical protein
MKDLRKCLCLAAAGLVLAAALAGAAQAREIYVLSRSSSVKRSEIVTALPALQQGVREVQKWWGGEPVTLHAATRGQRLAGKETITIRDPVSFLDGGGWHFLGPGGVPYAIVIYDADWTLIASHELDEMVVNPQLTRTIQGDRLYLAEVADPVEDTSFSYYRPGLDGKPVELSDFVGPDWYTGGRYFDYRHHVRRAHQLLYGGYVSYWDGADWAQLYGPGLFSR